MRLEHILIPYRSSAFKIKYIQTNSLRYAQFANPAFRLWLVHADSSHEKNCLGLRTVLEMHGTERLVMARSLDEVRNRMK